MAVKWCQIRLRGAGIFHIGKLARPSGATKNSGGQPYYGTTCTIIMSCPWPSQFVWPTTTIL